VVETEEEEMKMLIALLVLLLAGCSSVKVNRGSNGELDVAYWSFFTKVNAPSLDIERDSKDEYTAKFNAESIDRTGDIGAMRDIIYMGLTGRPTEPEHP
jgi:hypothetical protein